MSLLKNGEPQEQTEDFHCMVIENIKQIIGCYFKQREKQFCLGDWSKQPLLVTVKKIQNDFEKL